MNTKTRSIEIDESTAETLKELADARGMSVSRLLAEFVKDDGAAVDVESGQIAELDRRWDAVQAGEPTVPHEKVVRWLDTWGTSAFKPWRVR